MDSFGLILSLGSLPILFITILLVIVFLKSRNDERNKTDKVDYGKVYCINVVATFVPVNMLSDNIYEFFIFQGCLLLGSLFITRYIDNKINDKERSK